MSIKERLMFIRLTLKDTLKYILVPRGRAPFGQHQESDLWPSPTPEVRDSRTSRHSAHVQSEV